MCGKIATAIKGGQNLLYILSGEDDFSISQSLEEIKRSIGDQSILMTNTTILDGQQLTLDQLKTVCETVPFLSEKRLIIVEGLLGRFESRSRASRQRKLTTEANQKDDYKSFGDYIVNIPDSVVLVLIEGKISRNNQLFKKLSDKAEVRPFPLLNITKLRQWIQKRVAEEGGSISPKAIDLLTRLIGSNLWIMASEISKLVLFTSGRRIEEEDIKLIVSYARQASVFAMVDAILEFKASVAEKLLHQLLQEGAAPAYLLFMLLRQVRMIVRAKDLKKQRKSKTEIQSTLGITAEFALRKTLEQADSHSFERLKAIYHKLLEADLAIKTGKYGDELALNILITELCQRRVQSVKAT